MLGTRSATIDSPKCGRVRTNEADCFCLDDVEVGHSRDEDALATVAHELRGPLATILFALEGMNDRENSDPTFRQARKIAERQARRAIRIIDDLFDVYANSHGKLSIQKEIVAVTEIVAVASETVDHLITTRRHRLTISLSPTPVFVLADPLRLEQVLTNLLSNAAKFTEPGGNIHLSAEADAGQIVLRVRDDGQGIAPHFLPHVFDLFFQGNDVAGQRSVGLGIGLALVKSLVELHGGRVAVFSDGPGRGAEFQVYLPACSRDA